MKKAPFLITFTLALAAYLVTMPRGLTWAHFGVDGGDLIAASVTLGVPHPPGYPLYVVLGKLVSALPVGTVAYRFTLLSAVPMALTAALLSQIVLLRTKRSSVTTAVFTGLTFAFARLVWQQAVITEVYGLFLLCVALTVWALLSRRDTLWIGLLWGLAVVSHLTGLLLAPLIVGKLKQRFGLRLVIGFLFGLMPFLLLPLLARSQSPVVWGDPTTIPGWFELVTARLYADLPHGAARSDIVARLGDWGVRWAMQFSAAGVPLLVLALWQERGQAEPTGLLLVTTAVLYFYYALTYATPDAIIFALPGLFLLAILLGNALERLKLWAGLLPLTLLLLNFSAVDISQDQVVHQQLTSVLQAAPHNAVLQTTGDPLLFALWYAVFVEQMRSDVLIVDEQLFAFDWYRQRLHVQDAALPRGIDSSLVSFRAQILQERPYCVITQQEGGPPHLACEQARTGG